MIRYEIKKIFSKSLSKVSLVVLLFSLLISCYFAITNVSFLDEQGKSPISLPRMLLSQATIF